MIRERLHMLIRAKRTIKSANTPAQIECAIRYKDIVLKYLFEGDEHAIEKWDQVLLRHLDERAMIVCGLIEEDKGGDTN